MIVYPKVLGETIDHLIGKDYQYIWFLVLNFITMMFFGYISRIYDIKVFSAIYRKFASNETKKQFDSGVETTKINGRLTLMNAIVRFFEFDMLVVLQTLFGVLGSLYFLSLVSWQIVGFLVITGVAILFVSKHYSPKVAYMIKLTNDISEEQTDIIGKRKIGGVNNLLRRGQKIAIKNAYINSNFGLWLQAIVYGSVTALLTYYVMCNKVTVGSVFSTYRYLFDFCNALMGLPTILTSYINIKDVIKRLKTEE
jgi:ABC-type bacteriocin/lantibiotic exporter with double-glycine peptidase domain